MCLPPADPEHARPRPPLCFPSETPTSWTSRPPPTCLASLPMRSMPFSKKGELPGRKVARRWLTTRDMVLGWLKGASEQDTLARAIANGDQNALTAALKSGKVQVKKQT